VLADWESPRLQAGEDVNALCIVWNEGSLNAQIDERAGLIGTEDSGQIVYLFG